MLVYAITACAIIFLGFGGLQIMQMPLAITIPATMVKIGYKVLKVFVSCVHLFFYGVGTREFKLLGKISFCPHSSSIFSFYPYSLEFHFIPHNLPKRNKISPNLTPSTLIDSSLSLQRVRFGVCERS